MPPERMRSPALTLLTAAPAYIGAGHLGTGAEPYWRHIERCSKAFASPLESGASLGDDFSAGNRGQITSLDFSAFDQTTTLTRFRQVALSFIVGATHEQNNPFYCSAVIGYHECLAHQLQHVSGYYIPGRSAWPSAVPHTSYGDSFPATGAGINIILSTDKDFDASSHKVICKPGSRVGSKIDEQGLNGLSCQWKKENGERKRQFLNFQKLLYGLPYDFGEEKAEGRFSVITDEAERSSTSKF